MAYELLFFRWVHPIKILTSKCQLTCLNPLDRYLTYLGFEKDNFFHFQYEKKLTQKNTGEDQLQFFQHFVSLFIEVKITIHLVGIQIGGKSYFSVHPVNLVYFW